MIRRVIAGLVVVGLAIGIWVLWPREEPSPAPTTTIHAVASSTSTKVATRTTSSSIVESHVVTTVEEAEEILRQLWFGWFEGIYNQDEDRIKEVVATQALLDSAVAQFESMEFASAAVARGQHTFVEHRDPSIQTTMCLVIWAGLDVSLRSESDARRPSASMSSEVSATVGYSASVWAYRDDLWEADCESSVGTSVLIALIGPAASRRSDWRLCVLLGRS